MASSLPLPLNLSLSVYHKSHTPLQFTLTPYLVYKPYFSHSLAKTHGLASPSPPNPSNNDREEVRWLREEQRWLREEQRWLREESRWHSERESLLRQISDLKFRIQALEQQNSMQGASISETFTNIAAMLQVLKDADLESAKKNMIAESGSSSSPMVLEAKESEKEVEEMAVKEIRVLEREEVGEVKKVMKVKRRALRKGSEGDEVQAMQEALQKLGFYSGEEDMEYSSFSSGTERAVKTWQATQGAPEDGIMTSELLEMLYTKQQIEGSGSTGNADLKRNDVTVTPEEFANGAVVSSITDISEIQQTVVKEEGVTGVDLSHHRVFLLGENRWEEPSRLVGRDKLDAGSKTRNATKCLTCRGEGRLLCMECDGTGEPNIEPQFLEWIGEETKCPYCEGLGYTICDGCGGKTTT